MQKGYSDDGLSGYTVSSLKAHRHRYILFEFMVSSAFFRLQSGLTISWALQCLNMLGRLAFFSAVSSISIHF